MVNRIERRNGSIEIMRTKYLEYYYDKNQNDLDDITLRALGLNMYVKNKQSVWRRLYDGFCRSAYDIDVVLHPQQVECLNYLLKGENLLISAPTSFGKTFVALEYIARRQFDNIVFVVPTLALMNELFSKIKRKFGEYYNIVQNGYEKIDQKNIIIIVPERADIELLSKIQTVDLLIFDEIYKLQRSDSGDKKRNRDKRVISLNRGYFELVNRSKQVILLGPFIRDITFERTKLMENITKYITDYSPVYVKINYVDEKDEFVLGEMENSNAKLIYFNSPHSIYDFCVKLLENNDFENEGNSLTDWCDKYITKDWLPSELLKKGIGIHHGKLPGFMRKYIENLYNAKELSTILCTSTLLEGINTPTNELIVYDSDNLSAFRLNNLIGRVGRLNTFQKGQVYLFDRKLEALLIGEGKYEDISIVAENNELSELEECIYLNKPTDDLSGKNLELFEKLQTILAKYDKTIEELTKTDGFVISEFIKLLEGIDEVFSKVDVYLVTETEKDKYTVGYEISELLFQVIDYSNKSIFAQINNKLPPKSKIKKSVCINKLLRLRPSSIYARIQEEIQYHQTYMDGATLNLFIDMLFDLAFSYIKYDLSRLVRYFDFIFSKDYLENKEVLTRRIDVIEKVLLRRLREYCCDNDLLLKILIDLDLPYRDAKNICKIIGKVEAGEISTSRVLDIMDEKYDKIIKSKNIENVTKDLLKVLLNK